MDKGSEKGINRGGQNSRPFLWPGSVPSFIMVRLPRLSRHEHSGIMYSFKGDHFPVEPFLTAGYDQPGRKV
jgi:hypothetical protein